MAITFLDVTNQGSVTVKRSGCCRDVAALLDAEDDTPVERPSVVTTLLGGALLATGVAAGLAERIMGPKNGWSASAALLASLIASKWVS